MTKKKGYISRTEYYKYFNSSTFTVIYKYIRPVIQRKPETMVCHKCKVSKPFVEEFFSARKAQKYGLSYTCRECENKIALLRRYRSKGIFFNKPTDIQSEKWWDYLYEGKISLLPEFCLEEDNVYRIVRHVIYNKMQLRTKEDICDEQKVNRHTMKKFKIYHLYTKIYSKLDLLRNCFPELKIENWDISRMSYDDEVADNLIMSWIEGGKLSTTDLLSKGISYKFTNKIRNLIAAKFKNKDSMLLWYFEKHNILHPITGQMISMDDFEDKPPNFWQEKENRVRNIKRYCASKGIDEVIESNEKLKRWVEENFRQEHITNVISSYTKYCPSLYDALVEAYPNISKGKLLFKWEWHQFNDSNKDILLQMLREFILYRMNEIIKNPREDIPKYINRSFIQVYEPKLNKHIDRKRFSDFYDWCCQAFPEYADFWGKEDFGIVTAYDGTVCDSVDEKVLYEFVKTELQIPYIKAIGRLKRGTHKFVLPDGCQDGAYCPDFVIEFLDIDGRKTKLNKKIYIEYYGMFYPNYNTDVLVRYREKTVRKNAFYKSLSNIYFIDLYPDDLKNRCGGLVSKIQKITDMIIEDMKNDL